MSEEQVPERCCEKCRFWKDLEEDGFGECRLNPPVIIDCLVKDLLKVHREIDGNDHSWPVHQASFKSDLPMFPVTAYSDYCGQHKWGKWD